MSLAALTLASLFSATADAAPSAEEAVHGIAEQHFAAIRDADRAALRDLWLTRKGTVTHVDGGLETVYKVRRSIGVWTEAPEPNASWEILGVEMVDETTSTVTAKLIWHGAEYDETLTLIQHRGDWRLVAKTYSTEAPPPSRTVPGPSRGYGG